MHRDDEYGAEAFKDSTLSHVNKPFQAQALRDALRKAEKPNRAQLAALTRPANEGGGPRSHISARTRKGIELIPLPQVIYFIADHKYVTLRHETGEVLLDEPLKAWKTNLASASCASTVMRWSPASVSNACSAPRWGTFNCT